MSKRSTSSLDKDYWSRVFQRAAESYAESLSIGFGVEKRWTWSDSADHEVNLTHHLALAMQNRSEKEFGCMLEYKLTWKSHPFDLVAANDRHVVVAEAKNLYAESSDKPKEVLQDIKRLRSKETGGAFRRKFRSQDDTPLTLVRVVIGSLWIGDHLKRMARAKREYLFNLFKNGKPEPDHGRGWAILADLAIHIGKASLHDAIRIGEPVYWQREKRSSQQYLCYALW